MIEMEEYPAMKIVCKTFEDMLLKKTVCLWFSTTCTTERIVFIAVSEAADVCVLR